MQKTLKLFVLNLLILLSLGLTKISAQINISVSDARKINETYAKLDLVNAQVRLLQIELKNARDSTSIYKDSTNYFKDKAIRLKRRRNNWRTIAIIETIYIALTTRKKSY
jgi:hypothetical protein